MAGVMPHMEKTHRVWLTGSVIGGIYVTVCYRVPDLINMEPLQHVYLSFAVLFPASLLLTVLAKRGFLPVVLFVSVGVAIGTVVDVFSDVRDRNLFPFEILWWWVLFAPAVFLGAVAGWIAQRMRHSKPLEPTR